MLILFSLLILGLPSGLFSSRFPTRTLHASSLSTLRAIRPVHHILLHFYLPNNIWCGIQITELLVMRSFPLRCYLVPIRYKYLSQHNNLSTSACVSLSLWETKYPTSTTSNSVTVTNQVHVCVCVTFETENPLFNSVLRHWLYALRYSVFTSSLFK